MIWRIKHIIFKSCWWMNWTIVKEKKMNMPKNISKRFKNYINKINLS